MSLLWSDVAKPVRDLLHAGTVIPAHPLALNAARKLAPERQRALTRYYVDAGAGGVAVGVHTTQFEIRAHGLYEPVLKIASETIDDWAGRPMIKIAGLIGPTEQAVSEARIARGLGYHVGLLGLAALKGAGDDELIAHCRQVADEIPIMGFYLQTAVGGQHLGFDFWRRFAAIENVVAIKMAPFDRYRTLDVVRGIVAANAEERVTLYTGNDDNIVLDLLAPFTMMRGGNPVTVRIKGGLLGHWSVWTKAAVDQFERIKAADGLPTPELLALHAQVTDSNAAFFDVLGGFKGCIAGCHEVLRRQGLLEGRWCLNEDEDMGAGQVEEIERVYAAYPHLNDDAFVARNLARWLA